MDKKFYVSFEAARLLKEKGYRDKTMYGYCSKDQSMHTLDTREDYDWNYPDDEFYSTETGCHVEMFAAPTKAEAIDWLESKGIVVVVYYFESAWQYLLFPLLNEIEDRLLKKVFIRETYPTRLEAEEAAIIKACEIL